MFKQKIYNMTNEFRGTINGIDFYNVKEYNEYLTDIIIAIIVYLSSFSLVIKLMLTGKKKKTAVAAQDAAVPADDRTAAMPPESAAAEKEAD